MFLGVCNLTASSARVAVSALPVRLPVTVPLIGPTNPVAVIIPDTFISPYELIPTPFWLEFTSSPT